MTTPSMPLYREIQLTQGQVALVSAHRFEELNAHKWCALWCKETKSFYASRGVKLPNGKWTAESMHRRILGLQHGEKLQGDHINHDTLDNRDENLRTVTQAQNQHNRGANRNSASGLKGVYWMKHDRKWIAQIRLDGKSKYLGSFDDPISAHAAYAKASLKYHGEFGRIN